MTRFNPRFFAVIPCLILASISASGQIKIDTFAGGHVQSGVSAQNVAFGIIAGITRDPKGNLVFCDSSTNVIRRITADGTIQTIAGVGIPGYGGDGGPATSALLNNPGFPKYDAAGNLFFADTQNFRIRRIDVSGVIATVAGTGIRGTLGMPGPALQAQIELVTDLVIDKYGYVYFSESFQPNLRRLTPSGRIETFASCSGCAIFGLAFDPTGNLYAADQLHIFRISPDGVLHDFAGFGDAPNNGNGGPALNAPPSVFNALAADDAGNLYTEEANISLGEFIIRRIGADDIINVVAGTLTASSNADGPALQTNLDSNYGIGLTADANGVLTFAEGYRIRQLTAQSTIETVYPTHPQPALSGTAALDAWFVGPTSIAFNRTGELYIGQACIIQRIDSTGQLFTVAGTGQCSATPPTGPALTTQLNNVQSIAVDSHGQVYFTDENGSVYLVSSAGVISKVAQIGSAQNGIFSKLAIDSHDRVYFLSYLGVFGRIASGSPPEYISNYLLLPGAPQGQGLAVDAADDIYICCDRNYAIDRYTPDLQFAPLAISAFRDYNFPPAYGIAIDSSSNIWQGNKRGPYPSLWKGTLPFGGDCCVYGDGGSAESAYILQSALAFAPNGDLYVLDSGANRIRRIHGSPPTAKPSISAGGIVNSLSLIGGAIAPGELVSIFGSNFGPPGLDVSSPHNNVFPKALNNVHVYFGGGSGAITARTANQINVFVPYSAQNVTSIQVVVDVDGVTSDPVTIPVAPAAFGLVTSNASGSGQAAMFNQDGSLNSHSHPAARGSVVTMFGTGEGVTTPALADGALVISTPYSTTQSPVTVKFGGQTANVTYAGAAPFLSTGVFQIDATIPSSVTPGDVPIAVSIGAISTTRNVTVAVR